MAHHIFKETINSYWYVWLILTQFFRELRKEKNVQLLPAGQCDSPQGKLLNE